MTSTNRAWFELLEGDWAGNGEILPNPWGGSAGPTRARWQFRRDATGLFLLSDYTETRHDGTRFAAHCVFAIEPGNEDVLMWAYDSYGYPPTVPARGRWADQTLALIKETPRGSGRTSLTVRNRELGCVIDSRPSGAAAFEPVMRCLLVR